MKNEIPSPLRLVKPVFLPLDVIKPVALRERLVAIRRALSLSLKNFPDGCCIESALFVQADTGFGFDAGQVNLGSEIHVPHCWNVTPAGKYHVDLTYRQIDSFAPAIAIFSSTESVLVSDSRLRRGYMKSEKLSEAQKKEIEKHL